MNFKYLVVKPLLFKGCLSYAAGRFASIGHFSHRRPLLFICNKCFSTSNWLRTENVSKVALNDDGETPVSGTQTIARDLPLVTSRKLNFPPPFKVPKQAWLETLVTVNDQKLGILDLHPDIFATFPRVDILHDNIRWQENYRFIDYRFERNRAEMPGGGRKPWPQKGMGRARHGSIRSPLWKGGGKVFGHRGPLTHFYMLAKPTRTLGLCVALSCKYAQDDLHIVDSLDIPEGDPKHIESLIEERGWGISALFVDDADSVPESFAAALENYPQYNVMPVYSLNVHSMLKHESLVLTQRALDTVEDRLLTQLHSAVHGRLFTPLDTWE